MRVVLVGPYPWDPERIDGGGVATSLMTLVSALGRFPDVEPHVIAFMPGLRRPTRKEVDGIPVFYLPRIRRLGSLTFHLQDRRALARLLASIQPELVHAQDVNRYGFVCLKAVRGVPVVVTVHGISGAELEYEPPLARLRVLIAGVALERYCVRHARYLTQSTRYPEQYFGSAIRGRIWEIANPIPDRFFSVDPAPEEGRILYAGAVIPRKRLLDLVEAMRRVCAEVSAARLYVAGGELQSAYARKVQARVRELGLESRVVFLGPRSPAEMVEECRRASVFVLPSGQETSPLSIGEAMAAGLPVVATLVGGTPSLVDEGRTGHLVAPGDASTLAERIVSILRDPERAATLGAAGRAKADQNYRIGIVSSRYRAMYEEVIRSGRP